MKRNLKLSLTVFLLVLGLFLYAHPFYVSITNVDYRSDNKTVEISTRIFYDDFEVALTKEEGIPINILQTTDKGRIDAAIANYTRKYFILSINGKRKALNYLGYEIIDEAIWCYFEIPKVTSFRNLEISNQMLFREFRTQSHIFHVTVNGKRQSTKIDNPKSTIKLTF